MCGETFKRIIGGGAVITATKEVVFDCAHMLSGHEGLCKNLHGHTYKVQVTVGQVTSGGRDRLIPSGPSASMVIDFKHLKEALNEVIVEPFDHAFVFDMDRLHEIDSFAVADVNAAEAALVMATRTHGLKTVAFPGRPTAERMSRYFGESLVSALAQCPDTKDIKVLCVRVYETPTSYAEWSC